MTNVIPSEGGCKFILLSYARTGSTLLKRLLNCNPAIEAHDEIFNMDSIDQNELEKALNDPIQIIDELFQKRKTGAVGFKLFYDHLTMAYFNKPLDDDRIAVALKEKWHNLLHFVEKRCDWNELESRFQAGWKYLENDKSIKVIHLIRENKLASFASLQRACQTNVWWSGDDQKQSASGSISLTKAECEEFFIRLDAYEQSGRNVFKTHPVLEITYEQLVSGIESSMVEIYKFLEVPYVQANAASRKQNAGDLRNVISNFDELKAGFSRTKWSKYFVEESE